MGEVLSLNISSTRGIDKTSVKETEILGGWGLKDDAHGGEWNRQVSIFPVEALARVPPEKRDEVCNGGYTENITITGIPLDELSIGKTVQIGNQALLKILYIGKDEFKDKGRPYIVSREGRFGIVVKGGKVKVGDPVRIIES